MNTPLPSRSVQALLTLLVSFTFSSIALAEGKEFSADTVGYSYMLQGDAMVHNHDPSASQPDDSGHWVQEGPHLMLLMPVDPRKK